MTGRKSVFGIIAEYNPFHNGHLYQIDQVRKNFGADYVVVVMSGDFVQRGAPALFSKEVRTRMALSCGADLVISLPVHFSTASAEGFAEGGIRILDGLGVVDQVCFGWEGTCGKDNNGIYDRFCRKMNGETADRIDDGTADRIDGGAADRIDDGAADRIDDGAADRIDGGAADRIDDGAADRIDGGTADRINDGTADRIDDGAADRASDLLLRLAEILVDEPEEFKTTLKAELQKGRSFPLAREKALERFFPSLGISEVEGHVLLSSPNNILAIEYCKALVRCRSGIRPRPILRSGAGYHEDALRTGDLPSASALRKEIKDACEKYPGCPADSYSLRTALSSFTPPAVCKILLEALRSREFVLEEDLDEIMRYALLMTNGLHDQNDCYLFKEAGSDRRNVQPEPDDLTARIFNHLNSYTGFLPYAFLLKTRSYTYTRICRELLHIMLGLSGYPDMLWARVLGFRKESAALLSEIKKSSRIPLITKVSAAEDLLSPEELPFWKEDIRASLLYNGLLSHSSCSPFRHEYEKSVIISDAVIH